VQRPRVDRHPRRAYLAVLRTGTVMVAVTVLAACAGAPPNGGAPDPEAEARAVAATLPAHRLHVVFDWHMTDRDARFGGRGALRLDRGYRARVDLFGPRGETLAAAIVEDGQMRVVPAGADALLPPPALLWSTLGVFRTPADAQLTSTTWQDGSLLLGYARDAVRWSFRFEDDRLRGTSWTDRTGRRTVELSGSAPFGLPAEAQFRDWAEFRELTLTVTDVEEKASFESDVWILPGHY
jgi:hypothetical protein